MSRGLKSQQTGEDGDQEGNEEVHQSFDQSNKGVGRSSQNIIDVLKERDEACLKDKGKTIERFTHVINSI